VTRVTATENRLVHADPDVETTLSALEAAGLVVVTHLVPVGQMRRQMDGSSRIAPGNAMTP
jgi:hypothetical protein